MTVESIAQVAHELNKAYCSSIGDNTQTSWEEAPQWQKDSAVNGVKFHMANSNATPENSHESWLKQKADEGWKFGLIKNAELKEHPCFCPYSELPAEQRAKDYIFRQTVHSLASMVKVPSATPTRGQQVMSVTFNPGQREDVAAIKQIFADCFDEIDRWVNAKVFTTTERSIDQKHDVSTMNSAVVGDIHRLTAIAKTNLETAQMYAVKAVTR